jgi:hypothetical protein
MPSNSSSLRSVCHPGACSDLDEVGHRPRPLDLTRGAAARSEAARAVAPRRPPSATRPGGDSKSSRSRSRARAADAATRSRYAARTGSPAAQPDHPTASDSDAGTAAPSSVTAARTETIHGATAIGTPPNLTTDAEGVRRQGTGPFIPIRVLNRFEIVCRRPVLGRFGSLRKSLCSRPRSGSDGTRTRDLRRDRPVRRNRPQPAPARNTGYSRRFLAERTGCDRLRAAAARQSLCGTRVVDVVPTPTTAPRSASMSQRTRFRPARIEPVPHPTSRSGDALEDDGGCVRGCERFRAADRPRPGRGSGRS